MKEAIEAGPAVFDRLYAEVCAVRERRLSEDNFLRAFYLEVKGNLELLSLLKDDALKGKSPADPGFACFTGKLQTQLATALFFEGKGGGGPARRLKSECPGILKDVSFTLVKIELLKRLSEFQPEEHALPHGLNLTLRLANIEKRPVGIAKSLSQAPSFAEFFTADEP
jgi:hypothetical protein